MAEITPHGRQVLEHVLRQMEEKPHLVDMESWVNVKTTKVGHSFCGTTACIAGNICVAAGIPVKVLAHHRGSITREMCSKYLDPSYSQLFSNAHENLIISSGELSTHILYGLDSQEGLRKLFYPDDWPEPFRTQMQALYINRTKGFGFLNKAERTKYGLLTIERFKHFLATGE